MDRWMKKIGDSGSEDVVLVADTATWSNIEKTLSLYPIRNVDELSIAISKITTETKQFSRIKEGLHYFFDKCLTQDESKNFFEKTMPQIAKIALAFPTVFPGGRLPKRLVVQRDATLTLARAQIACILSHAFFCTWPAQPLDYPQINFSSLYWHSSAPQEEAKLRAIIHYFERVAVQVPQGYITFRRQVLGAFPTYSQSAKPLRPMTVKSHGAIEDATGMLQVDFANQYLGGGVLTGGCVQEEIRFAMSTELIAACLFCASLMDNECLIMIGAERFSKYAGYAFTLKFDGDFVDQTPRDETQHLQTQIVAIDAFDYRSVDRNHQYLERYLTREVNKAFCGFYSEKPVFPVATGNWGCGAFLGDKEIKSLVQLVAASEAERDLVYYTYGEENFARSLADMYNLLQSKGVTVGDLWKLMSCYEVVHTRNAHAPSVFAFVKSCLSMESTPSKARSPVSSPRVPDAGSKHPIGSSLLPTTTVTRPHP